MRATELYGRFLGGWRRGVDQIGFYYDESRRVISVVQSTYDVGTGRAVVSDVSKVPLIRGMEPFDMVREISAERLKRWLYDIVTEALPLPDQHRNLYALARRPDDLYTQAVIAVCLKQCEEGGCLCPMACSPIGCLQLLDEPIEPSEELKAKSQCLRYWPVSVDKRTPFKIAFSALRRLLSVSDFKRWYEELVSEFESTKRTSISKFGGSGT
jgi:hypothetical protein